MSIEARTHNCRRVAWTKCEFATCISLQFVVFAGHPTPRVGPHSVHPAGCDARVPCCATVLPCAVLSCATHALCCALPRRDVFYRTVHTVSVGREVQRMLATAAAEAATAGPTLVSRSLAWDKGRGREEPAATPTAAGTVGDAAYGGFGSADAAATVSPAVVWCQVVAGRACLGSSGCMLWRECWGWVAGLLLGRVRMFAFVGIACECKCACVGARMRVMCVCVCWYV